MNTSMKLAYHNGLDKIIHIDNADNGKNCNCKCLLCDEELQARQGLIRGWHFKHHINPNCSGGQESALHKLGKQILIDNSYIKVPRHNTINYSNAVAEKDLETKRPDVTAVFNDEPIFFEIVVSNPVDYNKEEMFINGQHRSIEIDLSECLTSSFEEIKKSVLDKTENKRVIFWETEVATVEIMQPQTGYTQTIKQKTSEWRERLIFAFFAILFIVGIVSLLTPKKRK